MLSIQKTSLSWRERASGSCCCPQSSWDPTPSTSSGARSSWPRSGSVTSESRCSQTEESAGSESSALPQQATDCFRKWIEMMLAIGSWILGILYNWPYCLKNYFSFFLGKFSHLSAMSNYRIMINQTKYKECGKRLKYNNLPIVNIHSRKIGMSKL